MPKTRIRTIIIILIVAALCCLAVVGAYIGYRLLNKPQSASNLLVYFVSPANGSTVKTNDPVIVHMIARDPDKVTRVEFWVNGQLISNEHSPIEAGISPFPLVSEWIPPENGEYSLVARAYNSDNEEVTGEIRVTAVSDAVAAVSDRDLDGFPDEVDLCPDEAGLEPDGCPLVVPDADGDGVEDTRDECPDLAGAASAEGCPDVDGDGIDDEHDACPDEVGAADSPAGVGCPSIESDDRDGDGVVDAEDTCPDEAGAVESDGCMVEEEDIPSGGGDESARMGDEDLGVEDRDGDGVADDEDRCPDESGPADSEGCPEEAPDRDGDGFPDSVDLCPDEAGVDPDGCPAPEPEPEDASAEGGIAPGDMGFALPARRFVEFQALTFNVNQDYNEVYCYAGLNQDMPDQYGPFHFNGERDWDVTEYLGSINLISQEGGEVRVYMSCYAYTGDPGRPEFHYLGLYNMTHPESDWNGEIRTAWIDPVHYEEGSTIGDVEGFQATYRMCTPSCTAVDLPAPVLEMRNDPIMLKVLTWSWSGDEDNMDRFKFYINGTYWRDLPSLNRGMSIPELEPTCGEELTFTMTAAAGEHESAMSNPVTWAGPTGCRVVRVTYDKLITHDISDGLRSGEVGPIRGVFWADDQRLEFDADHFPYYGFVIDSDGETKVSNIFHTILDYNNNHQLCGGTACHGFYAPEVDYVEMEISEGEELTVGVRIKDADVGTDDTLIDTSETIPYEQIMPSRRVLSDSDMELVYYIDVIAGSGSSAEDDVYDPPDLRISTVDAPYGQLAARVENIGTGPVINQSITFEYIDRDNGDLLFGNTYENVDIPVGGFKWLSTGRSDLTLYGTVARINSEHSLEESEYGNNNFFTPTLMQFSLTEIFDNSHCESYWHNYSEHQYGFWVSLHLDSDTDISIANLRYPRTGYVRHEYRSGNDYLHPAEDDHRFNFQYPVPYNASITIGLNGYEDDGSNLFADDQGQIIATYYMEDYASMDHFEGHGFSEGSGTTSCPDNYPDGETYFGFGARWEIDRVD